MVSPIFLPKRDGTTRLIKNLADGLTQKNHKVTVITRTMSGSNTFEYLEGIRVFRVSPRGGSLFDRLKFIANSSILIVRLALRGDYDVIHAFGISAVFSSVLGNFSLKKIVTTLPGLQQEILAGRDEERLLKRNMSRIALKLLAYFTVAITAPTNAASTEIKRDIGKVLANRVSVVFNPLRTDLFSVRAELNSAGEFFPEILSVGNLSYRKGFDILIRALATLVVAFPRIRLTIVGKGPRKLELLALASSLNVENHVRLLDFIEDRDLARTYESCDIFVSPSRAGGEAFGYVLAEAMATGKPVISTLTPGPAELIQMSSAGLLVEPENVVQLTKAIQSLARDSQLRQKFGEKGLRFVHEKLGVQQVVARFEEIYR
ncbi:MAG: glycosyltransferase family 4 protein [Nitrososphaerota archaeon]|nr:glycosyltransferase family 4 protein [Nitrososphaerota archaeon]